MADNKQENDEYEFTDLDTLSADSMEESDAPTKPVSSIQSQYGFEKKDIRRNALIAVGVIILLMLIYKFTGAFFTKKTQPTQPSIATSISQPAPVVTQPVPIVETQTITPAAAPVTTPETPEIAQKLSTMDLNQQTIRSDVTNVSNQLGSINSNVNALNSKIASLSQMVTNLSLTVQQQSNQISSLLEVRAERHRPTHRVVHSATAPRPVYHIQAIIPGRAWLIARNGSTLTVREGTNISGYGVVRLIDPIQGRVILSSGRVIRFSQQDS